MTDTATTAAHGAAIRAARESCSPPIRRGELAERLGIASATLEDVERGRVKCSLPRAVAIANYIGKRSGRPAWQVLLDIAYPAGGDS
jgi:DNA-binding XRE family transcriptional regulator